VRSSILGHFQGGGYAIPSPFRCGSRPRAGERSGCPGTGPDLGLTLIGTAADDAGGGLAIIQRADGAVQFLELGHEIEGYTVARIEAARVILKNVNGEVILEVPGADPNGSPPAGPSQMLTASVDRVMVARDAMMIGSPVLVAESSFLYGVVDLGEPAGP
jgi:hypothetical protein